MTNENLSAEEQYAYRRDVFTNLPDMDWQEFGELGSTIDNFTTSEAFMSWLAGQESYSTPKYFAFNGLYREGIGWSLFRKL